MADASEAPRASGLSSDDVNDNEVNANEPAGAHTTEPDANSPGVTALGPAPTERKAREWSLVLASMGIAHAVRAAFGGVVLLVRDKDYVKASSSIDQYEVENRDWPPPRERERIFHRGAVLTPLLFAAALLFFFATGSSHAPNAQGPRYFELGASIAHLTITSEPWRAVTALTLHADESHVLGNLLAGSIFASAVDRRLGPGASALAIVGAGTLGNLANAAYHVAIGNTFHGSIGASTAVFAAIGILAAIQVIHARDAFKKLREGRRLHVVAPIIGGLTLLGTLGAGPRSDLGAHLFGVLAGLVVGALAAVMLRFVQRPGARLAPRFWPQAGLFAVAVGVLMTGWQLALT